jgi:hypothetical protein
MLDDQPPRLIREDGMPLGWPIPTATSTPKGYWTLAGYRSDGRKVLRWVHL